MGKLSKNLFLKRSNKEREFRFDTREIIVVGIQDQRPLMLAKSTLRKDDKEIRAHIQISQTSSIKNRSRQWIRDVNEPN